MRTLALAQPEAVELIETKDGKAFVMFLVSGDDEAIEKIRAMFSGEQR